MTTTYTTNSVTDATTIPPAVIRAIRLVESNDRPNTVRFEPHLFHRQTGGVYEGQVPWTRSRGDVSLVASETDRAAFERAARLAYDAAVRSSSWGAGQVLGGVGIRLYGSPQAFVRAFDANPSRVSDELMIGWFQGRPAAVAAVHAQDWPTLKRLYNGPGESPWLEKFLRHLEALGGASQNRWWPVAVGVLGLAAASTASVLLVRRYL